jgi:hypothetical protein
MSSDRTPSTLREIAYYVHRERACRLLVPRKQVTRVSTEAYALFHKLAERFLVSWFQLYFHPCRAVVIASLVATVHRKRVMVTPADARLVRQLHQLIKGEDIGGAADAVAVGVSGNAEEDMAQRAGPGVGLFPSFRLENRNITPKWCLEFKLRASWA